MVPQGVLLSTAGLTFCRIGCQEQNDTRMQFSPVLFHQYFHVNPFENVEDPEVIDTKIRTSKIGQQNTRITCCACKMRQGGRFHLEGVIRHLSVKTSLGRVDTPSGAPMQAKADRRGDDLAVTVTQGQRAQCIM